MFTRMLTIWDTVRASLWALPPAMVLAAGASAYLAAQDQHRRQRRSGLVSTQRRREGNAAISLQPGELDDASLNLASPAFRVSMLALSTAFRG